MKTKKELLQSYLDHYPELNDLFIDIIKVKTGNYNLTDLIKLSGINPGNVDSAIPVDYQRSIEEIYPDFNTGLNVFDYNDSTFGKMLNLNNLITKTIFKKLD